MKIGFFGTPEIGAYCLESLVREHDIVFAVSQEDKPQGRSLRLVRSPVSSVAERLGIPVFTPGTLKDEALPATLAEFRADIFVVVAYGKIIPSNIFNIPEHGSINLHPSLLPHLRGAAPVESAILEGASESGITIQRITERLDAGDILAQESLLIDPDMTAGDLYEQVLPRGADLMMRVLSSLSSGTCVSRKQNESEATYCGKITKENARIDWGRSVTEIHNMIRAYNPKPVAWTSFRGSSLRILKSKMFNDEEMKLAPGEIAVFRKKRIIVGTDGVPIEILSLQPENKKVMDGLSFINGYRIMPGDSFS